PAARWLIGDELSRVPQLEAARHLPNPPSLRGGRRPTRQSIRRRPEAPPDGSPLWIVGAAERPRDDERGVLKVIKSRGPRCAATDRGGAARLETPRQAPTSVTARRPQGRRGNPSGGGACTGGAARAERYLRMDCRAPCGRSQ